MVAEGFVAAAAFLNAVLAVRSFRARQVAILAVPAAGTGARARQRIALGSVGAHAEITAARTPAQLRASYKKKQTNKQTQSTLSINNSPLHNSSIANVQPLEPTGEKMQSPLTYGAGRTTVARLALALIGTDAGTVQALLAANRRTTAIVRRLGESGTALFNQARLLNRLTNTNNQWQLFQQSRHW